MNQKSKTVAGMTAFLDKEMVTPLAAETRAQSASTVDGDRYPASTGLRGAGPAAPGRRIPFAVASMSRLLCFLLALGGIAASKAEAANPRSSIVGAIRWDAWMGDDTNIVNDVGEQVNRTLGPARYHYRLPFFAQETGPNSVNVDGTTQAIMDQEIAYAKNAGIHYWAFHYYADSMKTARELYLSSAYTNDLKFCISVDKGRMTDAARALFVEYFKMGNYQTVLSGRPLIYIFDADTNTAAKISDLRTRASNAGAGNPYVVFMNMGGAAPAGIDAYSSYASFGSDGEPYSSIATAERNAWNNHKNNGRKVVPWVTTGWDKRTRVENPVSWETVPSTSWAQGPSPDAIASQLQAALDWNNNNQSAAEANAVLMYAWNENDEGGWLTPTLYYGADRLNAIANVLGGAQQAVNTPPSSGVNLATGKTVTASSTLGGNYASKAVDGDPSSGWEATNQTAGAWLEVDFGTATTFDKTVVKSTSDNRITGYKIQYYNGSSWIDIATDKWITPYTPVTFSPVTASRARVYVTAASFAPIIHEFEVYNTTAAPELDVTRSGAAVDDGGTDPVTGTVAGVATSLTYTLTNSGSAALTITGATTVANQSNCTATVITQPGGGVAAGGSTSLVVSVTPTATGAWSFTLSTPNNDADENPYNWTVNAAPTGSVVATGGTVTNVGLYRIHTFTGSGTLNVTSGGSVEVLVVGGGGGGGKNGGGGGAGGLVYSNGFPLVAGTYTVIVGGGGAASTGGFGGNGTNSVFSNSVSSAIVAIGGGGGALGGNNGLNGGSGGGGGGVTAVPTKSGGTNTVGQGYMGGSGGVKSVSWGGAGGGGGAGGAGLPGDNNSNGGNGGTGVYVSAFKGVVASTVGTTNDGWFAGGGGGAEINGTAAGAGGRGGGGRANTNQTGTAGSPNTGGGGGGGCWTGSADRDGGAGGSGIVIVRYVAGGGVDPFEAWRQTYFTAEQLTNTAISSATVDPDEDGLNNQQEYWAGTNPTNALSCLVLYAATNNPATSGKFVLSWQSVSNKMYTVMAATNLLTGFTDLATNIQATPTVNVHTDSVGSAETKFYRVKLE